MPGVNRRHFLALLGALLRPPSRLWRFGGARARDDRTDASAGQTSLPSRLILLGTAGGPTPKKTRSGPSQIIVIGERGYVIDCGDGVARQMMAAGVFRTLRHIFVTHHHSDHNADYGNLLLLAWGDALKTPVDTWGPPPLARITRLFFEMSAVDLRVRERDEGRPPLRPLVHPHEIGRGGFVMKDDLVTVTCAVVDHPLVPLALAYRFDCPDRSIVFSGDTRPSDALVALARGADVLVHEVLYLPGAPGAPGSALRKHIIDSHTTVGDAGKIATRAGVKTLVLSHFVPAENPPVTDAQWLEEARGHFGGRIVVGHDLLEL
jgi:ribonuclease BN (tRNA processing enzyme)